MLSSLSSTIITVFDIADLPSSAAPFRPRLGLPSFRLVRCERVILKKVAAYLCAYGGKGLVARPSSPLGSECGDCKTEGHQIEPGMTLSLCRRSRESFCRAA